MTVDEAVKYGAPLVNRREALILLSHITGLSHTDLLIHGEYALTAANEGAYKALLARRCQHEPLQYILRGWSFMGLDFITDPRALIPRQDTEVLAEAVLSYLSVSLTDKPPRLLDLCTGSGCIAVALAVYTGLSVTASDINPDALQLAKENAFRNSVIDKINFIESDLYHHIPRSPSFDIIVSNPPYIPTEEINRLTDEVKNHEPHLALDGGADGLDIYRKLIPASVHYLSPGGRLFLEIGTKDGVISLMEAAGFTGITAIKDYAGLERVVYGQNS